MSDPILTAVNRVYAEYLHADMGAVNGCMKAIRLPGANTDGCALELIGVLENVERKAKFARDLLRAALCNQMQIDGVVCLESDHWKATVMRPAASAHISDEKALKAARPELWKPQPDKLDRTELNKLVRNGPVPGATLTNGGAPTLRVSARKDV
ncbi:hypothetical protein [Acetobacter sp. P1H12_c]|uniref:hypothetical protein n=1 Tax=Acetobacter sp. P1H12_c TaxID=2762621 RepID=UPI001C04647A|nr:hypothetical protein [Acetobacter sp. P1H12_c]